MERQVLEVFADVSCPFTHVGLQRFVARRAAAGRPAPVLRVRAWPLEAVNGEPLTSAVVAPEVEAIRDAVAPDLFTRFDVSAFPATSRPALASAAAAYRLGDDVGERFSVAVREALFEHGRDIADESVLAELRAAHGVGAPGPDDEASIDADLDEGRRRGVRGSPHFFFEDQDFFCPFLEITHDAGRLHVTFDREGFEQFAEVVLG